MAWWRAEALVTFHVRQLDHSTLLNVPLPRYNQLSQDPRCAGGLLEHCIEAYCMTPQQFRKIALSLPDTVESEHMSHPDFRVGDKIFASLGAPSTDWGMVKLTPEQQQTFCDADSDAFQPCNGAWGRQGCTNVRLSAAKAAIVRSALNLAIENVVASQPRKRAIASPTPGKHQKKPSRSLPASSSELR